MALGEPKTASCSSKKQRESSRGPASKQESKFWVQAATHGRLAIGTRGEERMGIRLRICLMRKITEMMMGRAMAAGHGEHGRLSGMDGWSWPAHGKVTSLNALRGGIARRADLHLQGLCYASARL